MSAPVGDIAITKSYLDLLEYIRGHASLEAMFMTDGVTQITNNIDGAVEMRCRNEGDYVPPKTTSDAAATTTTPSKVTSTFDCARAQMEMDSGSRAGVFEKLDVKCKELEGLVDVSKRGRYIRTVQPGLGTGEDKLRRAQWASIFVIVRTSAKFDDGVSDDEITDFLHHEKALPDLKDWASYGSSDSDGPEGHFRELRRRMFRAMNGVSPCGRYAWGGNMRLVETIPGTGVKRLQPSPWQTIWFESFGAPPPLNEVFRENSSVFYASRVLFSLGLAFPTSKTWVEPYFRHDMGGGTTIERTRRHDLLKEFQKATSAWLKTKSRYLTSPGNVLTLTHIAFLAAIVFYAAYEWNVGPTRADPASGAGFDDSSIASAIDERIRAVSDYLWGPEWVVGGVLLAELLKWILAGVVISCSFRDVKGGSSVAISDDTKNVLRASLLWTACRHTFLKRVSSLPEDMKAQTDILNEWSLKLLPLAMASETDAPVPPSTDTLVSKWTRHMLNTLDIPESDADATYSWKHIVSSTFEKSDYDIAGGWSSSRPLPRHIPTSLTGGWVAIP